MISTPDRQNAIALIDQAKAAGARRTQACAELGIDAVRALAEERLARELEEDPVIARPALTSATLIV